MSSSSQRRLEVVAKRAADRSSDRTRHKCFVSYHQSDEDETESFIDNYGDIFIAKVLGVSDEDDFIGSDDTDYVMRRIRELYLTDSTVTIALIGKCTWSRRYVDWEVASTLRDDTNNKRSGLLAITLPSAADYDARRLPDRIDDNVVSGTVDGYASWKKYPSSKASLRSWIDEAFDARTSKSDLVDNSRVLHANNRSCP